MALTNVEIKKCVEGKITVTPFNANCVNPEGYDLHLDKYFHLVTYMAGEPVYIPFIAHSDLPVFGGTILGQTVEVVGSKWFSSKLRDKSSSARKGLGSFYCAGLVDSGYINHITVEMRLGAVASEYLTVKVGGSYVQIQFDAPYGDVDIDRLYAGQYHQEDTSPLAAWYNQPPKNSLVIFKEAFYDWFGGDAYSKTLDVYDRISRHYSIDWAVSDLYKGRSK